MSNSRVTAALLLALPSLASASTHLVGPAGSGAPFTTIQSAVDAAAPGDTILISAGSYTRFRVTKPLTILGSGLEQTIVSSGGSLATPYRAFEVTQLAAGAEVFIGGIGTEVAQPTPSSYYPAAWIHDNAGRVVLHELLLIAYNGLLFPGGPPALRVSSSPFVLLSHSSTRGSGGAVGTVALSAEQAQVWIANSTLRGGDSSTYAGADAAQLSDATLVLARSELSGGAGGAVFGDCGDGQPASQLGFAGGSALALAGASQARLVGGPDSALIAGAAFVGADCYPEGLDSYALRVADSSQALLQDGLPLSGPTLVGPQAALQLVHAPFATLALAAATVAPGQTLGYALAGTPMGVQWVYASPSSSAPFALPGIGGQLVLNPAFAWPLGATPLDGNGIGLGSTPIPADSSLIGARALVQALELGNNGLTFGNPDAVFVR